MPGFYVPVQADKGTVPVPPLCPPPVTFPVPGM
jgi:hypothetical protein